MKSFRTSTSALKKSTNLSPLRKLYIKKELQVSLTNISSIYDFIEPFSLKMNVLKIEKLDISDLKLF